MMWLIEFFEFLNTCSAARAITYLMFIIIMTMMTLVVLHGIVRMIMNGGAYPNQQKEEEDTKQQLNG